MSQIYRQANRRKCYWLCQDCLKGHKHRCSIKCPDYLSVARAAQIIREKKQAQYRRWCSTVI